MGKCNSDGSAFLSKKFSSISQAKLQERVFVVPQIREVLKDSQFKKSLSKSELSAWQVFKWLCAKFLGEVKSRSFQAGDDLLEAYKEMGCRMSLKLHFLNSHLNSF